MFTTRNLYESFHIIGSLPKETTSPECFEEPSEVLRFECRCQAIHEAVNGNGSIFMTRKLQPGVALEECDEEVDLFARSAFRADRVVRKIWVPEECGLITTTISLANITVRILIPFVH